MAEIGSPEKIPTSFRMLRSVPFWLIATVGTFNKSTFSPLEEGV